MENLVQKSILKESVNGKVVHFFFLSSFGDVQSVHTVHLGIFYENSQVNLFCSVNTSVSVGDLKTIQSFLNKYFNNNLPEELMQILGDINLCQIKS